MSQKKHKQLRRQLELAKKSSSRKKKISRKIVLVVIFSLMLVFLLGGISSQFSEEQELQVNDFQIELAEGKYPVNYFNASFDEAKHVLVSIINNLPDQEVRDSIIELIRSGEWQVIYNPDSFFAIRFNEFSINPADLLANKDKQGYLGSYLLHEHYHYQDWLGNNPGSENYHACELEGYSSRACQLEWWDSEWRAFRAQAIFLQRYDYVHEMTTGRRVNNQAIFAQNDPDHAALEYLHINYYIGKIIIDFELRRAFPEFYRKKFLKIS